MATRRRLLMFALPVVAALVVGMWLLWPRTVITRDTFDKVQVGMNLAEVEAVLGGPERNESTGPLMGDSGNDEHDYLQAYIWRVRVFDTMPRTENPYPAVKWWTSDVLMVRVDFDENGQVAARECLPMRRVHEGLFERLRRWLHL
jgi:hypothetical protein